MDITLTLKCNNNCVFCPRKGYLKIIACGSLKEIYRDIKKTRRASDKIVLSGGEVTLLKSLPRIIGFCRDENFNQIGIITNARRLKDPKFAEGLIRAGVKDFAVSIYSMNEKIHDGITRKKGSAAETKKGLSNLLMLSRKYPISIRVNLVLNYWNYKDMLNTLKRLFALGVRNFIIAEQIIINKNSRHLSLNEVKAFLEDARRLDFEDTRICLRGFPFCLFEYSSPICSQGFILKKSDPLIILERQDIDTLVNEREKKRIYFKAVNDLFIRMNKCRFCVFSKQCFGIQKAYLSYAG